MSFIDYASGISLPDCSKLETKLGKRQWCHNFHVNIITGYGVMTIFFCKGLTRNRDIGNTLVWILTNIWTLGWIRDANFTGMSVIKCYWMLQNIRVTALYHFWVIEGKSTVGIKLLPPTQIRVNWLSLFRLFFLHFNKVNSITNFLWF